MLYMYYKLAKSRGTVLYRANTVMPLSYAVCSAIVGTQSAVQGKCLSELINMTMKGDQPYSVRRNGMLHFQSDAETVIIHFRRKSISVSLQFFRPCCVDRVNCLLDYSYEQSPCAFQWPLYHSDTSGNTPHKRRGCQFCFFFNPSEFSSPIIFRYVGHFSAF